MPSDYERLVSKVDAASEALVGRRPEAFECRAGCAGCCHAELTIADVEARVVARFLAESTPALRARVAGRADTPAVPGGRCVMLDDDDLCAVHPARPLVCRTQGLALLYPPGFVPEAAVRLRTSRGDVTVCPLNYTDAAPGAEDLLDAGHVDTVLALVDRLDAEAGGAEAGRRIALRELARAAADAP